VDVVTETVSTVFSPYSPIVYLSLEVVQGKEADKHNRKKEARWSLRLFTRDEMVSFAVNSSVHPIRCAPMIVATVRILVEPMAIPPPKATKLPRLKFATQRHHMVKNRTLNISTTPASSLVCGTAANSDGTTQSGYDVNGP